MVHVFSPAAAAPAPASDRLLDGLRALSDLITPHCGQKVAVTANFLWLAADTASAVRTFRDPASSAADRLIEAGGVSADAASILAGILGAPHLDQAATAINFATVVGDHVHTGQLTFTPGELAQFSSAPESDDVSNLLKLTEVLQPPA